MKASLCRHDFDLLLLVHGELSPFRKLITKLHLASCSSCQARLVELTTVSRMVSSALGRPGAAPPIPAQKPLNPKRLALLLAVGVLFIVAIAAVSAERAFRQVAAQDGSVKPGTAAVKPQACPPGPASPASQNGIQRFKLR